MLTREQYEEYKLSYWDTVVEDKDGNLCITRRTSAKESKRVRRLYELMLGSADEEA